MPWSFTLGQAWFGQEAIVMANFFFHFCDGRSTSTDELGVEFDSAEDAFMGAAESARAMWPELLAERCDPRNCSFVVADENDEELFRLDFSELLDDCRDASGALACSGHALTFALRQTHRRVLAARADLRRSFEDVHRSLGEATALLGRISDFERRRLR
jgi:hypothetical protein